MADQLCTLAAVKTRLRIADVNDDVLLGSLIDDVSDWIQDATARKLVPQNAATFVVDTIAGSEIYVRRGIRTVTTLKIADTDQPETGGAWATTIPPSSIALRPGSLERAEGWPADTILILGSTPQLRTGINRAQIVGDFGFAATPPAIVEVAINAVVAAYGTRGKPASAVIGVGDRVVFPWATFFTDGSPQAKTIARYRSSYGNVN